MSQHERNDKLNRRDEMVLGFFALIFALMFAPALLGVL